MLSRLIPKKPYHFRRLFSLPSKQPYLPNSHFTTLPKPFSSSSSSNNNNNNTKDPFSNVWKSFGESDDKFDNLFTEESQSVDGGERVRKVADADADEDKWYLEEKGIDNEDENTLFKGIDNESEGKTSGSGEFGGHIDQPWNMKEDTGDVFGFKEEDVVGKEEVGELHVFEDGQTKEDVEKLEKEEKQLTVILEGPKRAFGDLIAASGITDEMLDSLIALKDFEGIDGLPPLRVIEDMRYENNTRKSTRAEMERLKQEEAAKARVRQVDDKGRAYGTGRRKCSIARVWVQPGNGKFMVNDKEFDVYFPMIDHRATLLRPFSETKTLGLWDVNCTVKGGGVSGQVGAIRLGVSKALQNWEPELRPALRSVGFLTRDSRVVERKKPGKAKARKSYQWVKR
ncbi:small ribosomal subunit protein uS9m [Vicia villosa]|uniref:small ribosomal subunit protein uS9m n=1 Tax=Vicia villosa TaxID=3911 RepID=UPI00273CD37B|nr:small ribosomal subunit protein uS9m [Vicia villosa]